MAQHAERAPGIVIFEVEMKLRAVTIAIFDNGADPQRAPDLVRRVVELVDKILNLFSKVHFLSFSFQRLARVSA